MSLTNIALLKYNNYYNRTIKKMDTLTDYIQYSVDHGGNLIYNNVNFFPADGVNTELVLNSAGLTHGPVSTTTLSSPNEADYAIEFDTNGIISRWFIVEAEQTRNGQYRLTLHRDVITDHYDEIIDAPVYIEKATVLSVNDVAIYNQEDITFNNIKTEEHLLKDKSNTAWIIGYYEPIGADESITFQNTYLNSINVSTIEGWDYYQYITNINKYVPRLNIALSISTNFQNLGTQVWDINARTGRYDGPIFDGLNSTFPTRLEYTLSSSVRRERVQALANYASSHYNELLNAVYQNSSISYNSLNDLNGKFIFVSIGTEDYPAGYYKINVTRTNAGSESGTYNRNTSTSTSINTILANAPNVVSNSTSTRDNIHYIYTEVYNENISLQRISSYDSYETKISSTGNQLSDAPYKMFAIPYSLISVETTTGHYSSLNGETLSKRCATAIGLKLGSKLHDLQLLPFCPGNEFISDTYDTTIINLTENVDYTWINDNNNQHVGIIYYPHYSSFSFDITYNLEAPADVIEAKIENQCTTYRLCSPNQAAVFEFNLNRNGSISKFNVDCTYKPISPYIHINPDFGKLYGSDFNDTRGLICSGDFSLPLLENKWTDFQIANKNYQNSFNRQIESIELNNKYQKISDITSAISGSVAGGVSGALAGSVGGPVGAIAGGIIGTVGSAAGGVADIFIKEKLRMDALDLTKDQFNYNLQNIQAMPNTLTKVSSFDANNKIFPILEMYTCTDQEKEIFKDKMKYNGMTIMRIDKIKYFINTEESYIKGKLIRLETIKDDFHMINSIADELNKGVFL